MIKPRSLQQRLALFLLLPVALLLFAMGSATYFYARGILLEQWREATILKLQRAAHYVDMRLGRPKEWIKMYHDTMGTENAPQVQKAILQDLGLAEGVAGVRLISDGHAGGIGEKSETCSMTSGHNDLISIVVGPHEEHPAAPRTVTLVSDLADAFGSAAGRLEVDLRFDHLVGAVVDSGWWHRYKAFLVDDSGVILTSTEPGRHHGRLGDNGRELETATFDAMNNSDVGTVVGKGGNSGDISGFYKLHQAPWTLIIFTPDKEILSTIHRFTFYFFSVGSAFVFIILILIRWVTGGTVDSVKAVSAAARRIAAGYFDDPLPVRTNCEVGELIRSFNVMATQLEERIRLKDSMQLAKQLQQCLLPDNRLEFEALDVAGRCIYGDEPGGDYYDLFNHETFGTGRLGIVVGDVSGHDISSSLFMTTARALLHGSARHRESISQLITGVNRLLCKDTGESGNFMTLFFMLVDPVENEIQWVRAGHDPAILYDTRADRFKTLNGKGIPLGVDDTWHYEQYTSSEWSEHHIALIGTDGIWEAVNPVGDPFGKDRLHDIIRKEHKRPAGEILQCVIDAVTAFRAGGKQEDDLTLVVVKGKSR